MNPLEQTKVAMQELKQSLRKEMLEDAKNFNRFIESRNKGLITNKTSKVQPKRTKASFNQSL